MRDLLDDIDRWRNQGKRIAIARVVDTQGSGPRETGAAMAVNEDGEVIGSVSGGCVEGAVVSEALAILAGEQPSRVVTLACRLNRWRHSMRLCGCSWRPRWPKGDTRRTRRRCLRTRAGSPTHSQNPHAA